MDDWALSPGEVRRITTRIFFPSTSPGQVGDKLILKRRFWKYGTSNWEVLLETGEILHTAETNILNLTRRLE